MRLATAGPADFRERLDAAFDEALRPLRQGTGPLGVLFSAGVDSSLLAWELRDRPEVVLCTLGRDASPDLRAGKVGAERLGLPWVSLPIDSNVVADAERRFSSELEGLPHVPRVVLLSLALAMERAPPTGLVCGQGADELFLGYAHYRNLSAEDAEQRSLEDMTRLREDDWPRTARLAEVVGKSIVAPYLSPSFEEAVRRVPIDLRLPGAHPKQFLREWAMSRGLPPQLAGRPKKALQYGSGVDALVRSLRRSVR